MRKSKINHKVSQMQKNQIESYRTAFNNYPLGMILFEIVRDNRGHDFRIFDINAVFANLLGAGAEDICGRFFSEIPVLNRLFDGDDITRLTASEGSIRKSWYNNADAKHYTIVVDKTSDETFSMLFTPCEQSVEHADNQQKVLYESVNNHLYANKDEVSEGNLKFKRMFEEHSAVILLIDAETKRIVDANLSAEQYYGWSRDELMQMKISDINTLSPCDIQEKMDLIKSGKEKHFEFKHKHKDGTITDVAVYSSKIEIAGRFFVHSIIHDLTEQKNAEEDLRTHLSLLQIAGKTARFGGWDFMLDMNESSWSDVVTEIHELPAGYKPNVEEGLKFYAPEFRQAIIEAFSGCVSSGTPYDLELQIITAKGRRVWVRTTGEAVRDEKGRIYKVQGSFQDIDERKRYEIALFESKKLYHSFVEHIPGAVFRKDKEGRYIFVNSVFCKMKAMEPEEILGKMPEELYEYEEKTVVSRTKPDQFSQRTLLEGADHHKIIVSTGKTIKAEEVYTNIDGIKLYYEVIKSPVYGFDGDIIGSQGIQFDITARKQAEIQLKEAERNLETIISNLPGFVYKCAFDTEWTMWYISEGCKSVTGYSPDDLLINKRIAFNDLIHPDYQQPIAEKWNKKLPRKEVFTEEYPIIDADGEIRWVWEQGRGVYDEHGELHHLEGFVTEITDRKKAEEAFFESELKLRKLFMQMTELVALCNAIRDEEGNIIDYAMLDCNNSLVERLKGVMPEYLGKKVSEVLKVNPPFINEIMLVIQTGNSIEFEVRSSILNSYFHASIVYLYKDVFAIIATDITESKAYSQALLEKNKELEGYVYITSHDLRSPLVNIQGFSARLRKQTQQMSDILGTFTDGEAGIAQLDEILQVRIPGTLDYIFNNVSKMDKMLNALLQISRTGRLAMNIQCLDMNALLEKVVKSLNYQITELDANVMVDNLPECYGDENMLSQLFTNLIVNAIKYKHPDRQLQISISAKTEQRKVIYRISDNGIGIAPQYQDKIWNVFFRIDIKTVSGDGIGLSLAKQIVDKHKGKIWVESDGSSGTVFFVELQDSEFSE